jgi:hypothetical protein
VLCWFTPIHSYHISARLLNVAFLDMLDMVHTIVELCKEAEITGGGFNQLLASSTQLKQKKCGQVVGK